jgi:DNA polymerase zeta
MRREAEWSLVHELGRVTEHDTGRHGTAKTDRWGFNQATTLNFTGRHVLPIWRILKADNKMQHNSFEHVAYHVLQQR